jgi:ribosomal protein S18 acetylase RimI-like enzyme
MEIIDATPNVREAYAAEIPELIWSTGPVSYGYQFGTREVFDHAVLGSWPMDGTLFGADATTLAIEDGLLMGIEIGMRGNEYKARQHALAPLWKNLIERGDVSKEDFYGLLERADHASWLNPVIDADTYYIHALAVKPEYRGKRIGFHLIDNAIKKARDQGYKKFQLDVMSDNPAVEFYRAIGLELLADTRAPKPAAAGVPPEYRMGMALS